MGQGNQGRFPLGAPTTSSRLTSWRTPRNAAVAGGDFPTTEVARKNDKEDKA